MKTKMIILFCVIALLLIGNVFQYVWNYSHLFTDAVPDEKTALIIAENILLAMYGDDYFYPGLPTPEWGIMTLNETVAFDRIRRAWVVTGVLPHPPDGSLVMGTVPEVVIRMRDGRIISVRHI